MKEQVKLILTQKPNGDKQQFMIFSEKIVGQGSYGTVKKAVESSRPQKELVVKILPYIDEKKRQKIQKQLEILKNLPQHENLVYVQPIKCYSTKNYYIFMQYCKDGTLEDLLKKKGKFTQEEVLDFFQQFMAGYKVLFDRRILHQDLKPENILIKKNIYKITDFGFSIFHQGYKYSNVRQGTLPYMPIQKLTEKQYYANTKSDVYALGVILFKMIIGNHPYITNKPKDFKSYISEVKKNKVQFQPNLIHNYSIKFQHFFDIVLKMIDKDEHNRIDFPQIYEYIETQQIFKEIKQRIKQPSTKVILLEKNINVIEQSNAINIPFTLAESQQAEFKSLAQKINSEKLSKYEEEIINKIEEYIIRNRIIVYFFDRLTRRVYVQKLKKVQYYSAGQEKLILSLLLLCKKMVQNIIKQYKNPCTTNKFTEQEMKIYRKNDKSMIKIIQKDESYLDDLVVDTLTQSPEIRIHEQSQLLEQSNKLFQTFLKHVKFILQNFIKNRAMIIKKDKSIVTIKYALHGLKILCNFEESINKAQDLESYFRFVETQKQDQLLDQITKELTNRNIEFSIDLGQISE